ncbi:MAG: tetratricopeptide repeat protein [Pseudomonadota bacterium]
MHRRLLTAALVATFCWYAPLAQGAEIAPVSAARAQLEAGEYQAAAQLADDLLARLDTRFDRFGMGLVNPLQIKAEALYRLGQFPAALDLSARAWNIVRYNEGLHSLSQIPEMQRLASITAATGDLEAANDLEEASFELALRTYGKHDVRLVDHLHRLANWYADNGHHVEALQLHARSRDITRQHLPDAEALLERSLSGITHAYLELGFPNYRAIAAADDSSALPLRPETTFKPSMSDAGTLRDLVLPKLHVGQAVAHSAFLPGEFAARELVALRREQHQRALAAGETADPQALADAITALGDWHQLLGQSGKALASYREAQTLAASGPASARFDTPELLYVPHPGSPDPGALHGPKRSLSGEVRLQVRIDNRGRVRHTRLVSSVPANLDTLQYVRAVRNAKYRPALADTGFVATADVPLRLDFSYEVAGKP